MKKGKRIAGFLPVILSLLLCYDAGAALSGNYTINGSAAASATNYQTFASAVSDMVSGTRADGGTPNGKGVSGAVTFNVANGTYTEQISIRPIAGTSATNRVTFQSATGDSSKAILTFASSTSSANNFTLQLDSADFLTFQKLTIQRTGSSTYGKVIELKKGATNNIFTRNLIKGVISTSTSVEGSLVYSPSDKDTNNSIIQNRLKYGAKGIYLLGGSTNIEAGTIIRNNLLDSVVDDQIYTTYQNFPVIEGNTETNMRGTVGYGIYLANSINGARIINNKILGPTGAYGIYINSANGTSASPGLVVNNMISLGGTGGTAGIYLNASTYFNIYYNSVWIYSTSTTVRAFYGNASTTTPLGNNKVLNNIFANTGGNVAIEVTTNAVNRSLIDTSDNNDFYVTGTVLGKWSTTSAANLAAWQTASNQDPKSVSVNPRFISNTDLHARAAGINGKAIPISGFTTDIDGQTRNTTTPDIGADEFTPAPLDAGLTLFVSPVINCAGTQNVTVRLRNAGTTKIDTVTITYLLDGVQQTSKEYYPGLTSTNTTDITVGTVGITSTAKFIKVFVSDPNNSSDADPSNDTISMSIRAAIPAGTYTIGGTSPNYSTFTAAVNDLILKGICGPVTFNVADGIYREKITIPVITGASATNRIIFQSASGDSSKVLLIDSASASTTNNFLIFLNGVDYITFRKMTLSRQGTLGNARVIEIGGAATNNNFLNNRILGGTSTTSTTAKANIYSVSDLDNNNIFRNNLIKYGSYGFYYEGTSSSVFETGTIIEDNIIDSVSHNGIRSAYQYAATVQRNKINVLQTTAYGIYIYYNSGTATEKGLYANNMVSVAGTGTAYGISLYYSSYQDVLYNSVNVTSTSTTAGRAFYGTSASSGYTGNRLLNNVFANTGGGVAIELTAASVSSGYLDTSDYNNLYATGSILGTWGATDVATLAAWRTTSGQDPKSVSVDPKFLSNTDLHSGAIGMNGKALPLSLVTIDIDRQTRNATTPDIGADEFTPPANDLAVTTIISPVDNTCGDSLTRIRAAISNEGSAAQSNFTISGNVTGSATQSLSYNYSGTLAAQAKDTITFSAILNTYKGGTYTITAYSALTGDADRTNDTAKITVKINPVASKPIISNVARCQSGPVALTAGHDSGTTLQWFSSATASTPLFTGDTFNTPSLNASTNYFVQASSTKSGSITTTYAGGTSTFKGNMFDIKPGKNIEINGFDINTTGTGPVTVEVYYRNGTFDGFETTSSAWTLLGYDTVSGQGTGNATRINPGKLLIPSGQTYGIFIYVSSGGNIVYTTGANQFSNSDLQLVTGSGLNSLFGNLVNPRTWNGSVYYNVAGCPSQRVPITVTINSRPKGVSIIQGSTFNGEFNANAPDSVCTGNTVTYELTPPTGFTNADFGTRWMITNMTFATANGTAASDTNITAPTSTTNGMLEFIPVTAAADSTYILNITVRNMSTGCDTTVTRYVRVSATPVAGFTTTNVCLGNEVMFTNTTTASRPGVQYRWNFGDGNTSDSMNASHTYTSAGTYTVSLVVRNATGCNDSIAQQVTVYPNPVANFAAISVCSGQSVQFIDSSSIPAGTITSRIWSFGDGDISSALNPSHRYDSIGTYNVKLVVTSANGCKDSITKTVNVYAQPVAGFTTANACFGDTVNFINTSTISADSISYVWNFGDGDTSFVMNPAHVYAAPGTYRVTLLVVSPNQCADTISQNVTVYSLPVADFTSSTVAGRTLQFKAADTTLASYTWDFGDGDNSAIANPTHTYSADGKYLVTLKVRNANGCEMEFSDSVTVILTGILHAPKADISVNIFPNPFQLQTNVVYTLDKTARVKISVYDLSGKEVAVLADQKQTEGKYTYTLDAEYNKMNSGIYLLRVLVDDAIITKQMIRLK